MWHHMQKKHDFPNYRSTSYFNNLYGPHYPWAGKVKTYIKWVTVNCISSCIILYLCSFTFCDRILMAYFHSVFNLPFFSASFLLSFIWDLPRHGAMNYWATKIWKQLFFHLSTKIFLKSNNTGQQCLTKEGSARRYYVSTLVLEKLEPVVADFGRRAEYTLYSNSRQTCWYKTTINIIIHT